MFYFPGHKKNFAEKNYLKPQSASLLRINEVLRHFQIISHIDLLMVDPKTIKNTHQFLITISKEEKKNK